MNKSYEKGVHKGLGLIEGHVEHLENLFKKNIEAKYPLIGYSKLSHINKKVNLKKELNNRHFYFVHSFYANVINKSNIIANNKYFNKEYPAVIQKDNILGMQFHFEISGKAGQDLMKKIIKLSKKI